MGVASDEEVDREIQNSPLYLKYNRVLDRESAYEMLNEKAMVDAEEAELARQRDLLEEEKEAQEKAALKAREAQEKAAQKEAEKKKKQKTSVVERAVTNASASVGRSVAREAGKSLGKELDKKIGGGKFFTNLFGSAASSAGGSLARGILGNLLK